MSEVLVKMTFLICVSFFLVFYSSLVQSANIDIWSKDNDIDYSGIVEEQFSHAAGDSDSGLFLSPLIEQGEYKRAQTAAMVVPDLLEVRSYSGYLTVNNNHLNHLFFWFFPAQKSDWMDLPLVLWLQGGPGGSSLYGLFEELGPFETAEDMQLKKRQFSWNRNANLLFIDQPVGTGFSFSETDFLHVNGTAAGEELYNAVVQFHQLFPNFQQTKFYITGESYAGHYIPVLGHIIHEKNPTATVKINLSGLMLGNPWSDPIIQSDYGEYLYNIGMLDYYEKQSMDALHKDFVNYAKHGDWSSASEIGNTMLAPYVGNISFYNFLQFRSSGKAYVPFLENIRRLIHARPYKFQSVSLDVFYALAIDKAQSVKPLIEKLLEHYPMVFYSGQLDIICAYPMTATLLRSLNWSGHDTFQQANRTKWCIRGEQVGYVKRAGNLYEVLVRNAGHMVPADQPEAAFELLQSVITAPAGNLLHRLNSCP